MKTNVACRVLTFNRYLDCFDAHDAVVARHGYLKWDGAQYDWGRGEHAMICTLADGDAVCSAARDAGYAFDERDATMAVEGPVEEGFHTRAEWEAICDDQEAEWRDEQSDLQDEASLGRGACGCMIW